MRLRQLNLEIQTKSGPFVGEIRFPDGLVVIWADNSMGKSTCVRSILVALGLEAMLTTDQSKIPLTQAPLDHLEDADGVRHKVLESDVYLQVENAKGETICVRRTLVGTRDKNLITVVSGPMLTHPDESYDTQNYFVNRSGGATREAGFHRFFADFLGWQLPVVQRFEEGSECPLYLQCLFPFFVVEQTRGWSSIVPPVPNQFRIRDVHKRAVEFILNMDAFKIAKRRQELRDEKRRIEGDWKALRAKTADLADSLAAVSRNIPTNPVVKWPPKIAPAIEKSWDDGWLAIDTILKSAEQELSKLVDEEIPRVEEIATEAEQELIDAEQKLRSRQSQLSRRLVQIENEQQEISALKLRLETLEEDIRRNKDQRTLDSMSSEISQHVSRGFCPVCSQSIQDSLVPLDINRSVMSVDDNIAFLAEQRRTYIGVLSGLQKNQSARRRRARSDREQLDDLRETIRVLRTTLVADGRMPSAAAIRERFILEQKIERISSGQDDFSKLLDEFYLLAQQWKTNRVEFDNLPKDDTTEADQSKLHAWSKSIRAQLTEYGFRSDEVDPISISSDSYKPEFEGFDLQTSISASDTIRTIWAYLLGLIEISNSYETCHPRFLIFDEPRQQSTNDVSFVELLKHASKIDNSQVVFFTSEDNSRLKKALVGIKHEFKEFDGRVLTREVTE